MLVREVMMMQAATCRPSDSLADAVARMVEHDCGCLPVVDDEGRVSAMITDRDIAVATMLQNAPPGQLPVSGSMSQRLFACNPLDTISQAAHRMSEHQVRRMPVVDGDGRMVGIVSLNDLATEIGADALAAIHAQPARATLEALCGISRHRTAVVQAAAPQRVEKPATRKTKTKPKSQTKAKPKNRSRASEA